MSGKGAVFFLFYFLHCIFYLFSFCNFIYCHFILFQFLTAINFFMFMLVRKRLLLVFDRCFDV
jgi:hypothetical protein